MKLSHKIVDKIFFGAHPLASPLQKILHRITNGKACTFEFRDGIQKGMKFRSEMTGRYFYLREDYENKLINPIKLLVHDGSVVYDIGAHYGEWTLVFSRLCGPRGKVFAFEPDPLNQAKLNDNLRMNSVKNVSVIPEAASSSIGQSMISCNGSMSAIGAGDIPITMTTLDEFAKRNAAPDFIIIDIEGHAGAALGGAANILKSGETSIVCEIHNESEAEAFRAAAALAGSAVETADHNHVFFRARGRQANQS